MCRGTRGAALHGLVGGAARVHAVAAGPVLAVPCGGQNPAGWIEWVVIEEPEMGLHRKVSKQCCWCLLELMKRGYKVVLSTR